MSTLIIAEHQHGQLRAITRHAATAAAQLGGDIHVLVAGHAVAGVAAQAAQIAGVSRVLVADQADLAHQLAERLAPLVTSITANYDNVIAASGTFARNVLPRVAALLDANMISDVLQIVSSDTFVRGIYAGNVHATIQTTDAKRVLSVRPTAFADAGTQANTAPLETLNWQVAATDARLAEWVSAEQTVSDGPELATARTVVSGGRALGSAEQFQKLLAPLAGKLGAAIGASRAAVDEGFAPNDWQVGQTGVVVAPELYLAVGISGAVQHLAGMKDSGTVVAINQDPDAPIFQHADYGLVGDLFTLLPELTSKL
ncbi:electron transfer flavoprotein subunit alpha/FixB family protein [Silvimonas iriomotensis]|uniref:Electron transfer flavoprotein subunit alpha n=1 Tax=Silvimonas iriomotensis TaxID=449662 RepID=A0ABQ2P6N6_9NEIS|nr:FAD-binding protein [Silvimonas iriomotensis]GGP19553.1 electron transfer flavoprotein subunit alpha [Silvimonas iriomotensis]